MFGDSNVQSTWQWETIILGIHQCQRRLAFRTSVLRLMQHAAYLLVLSFTEHQISRILFTMQAYPRQLHTGFYLPYLIVTSISNCWGRKLSFFLPLGQTDSTVQSSSNSFYKIRWRRVFTWIYILAQPFPLGFSIYPMVLLWGLLESNTT